MNNKELEEIILKEYKEDDNKFSYERISPYEKRLFIYKSDKCILCEFCINSCPVSALNINVRASYIDKLKINLEPKLCTLCSICYNVCLFDSIEFYVDERRSKKIIKYKGEFKFFDEKCDKRDDGNLCNDCEIACPRGAIKAYLKNGKNTIKRDEDKCIFCRNCEIACPRKAIEVSKFLEGEIHYDNEKCQACGACINICPTNSITTSKKIGEKIKIKEETCIYCKACMNVCPVNAIEVRRNKFVGKIEVKEENLPNIRMFIERARNILDNESKK